MSITVHRLPAKGNKLPFSRFRKNIYRKRYSLYYIYIYIHIYLYMYTYMYTYTCIHIYIYILLFLTENGSPGVFPYNAYHLLIAETEVFFCSFVGEETNVKAFKRDWRDWPLVGFQKHSVQLRKSRYPTGLKDLTSADLRSYSKFKSVWP
jgi:hypothetical protein